jgi:hypothetical protein
MLATLPETSSILTVSASLIARNCANGKNNARLGCGKSSSTRSLHWSPLSFSAFYFISRGVKSSDGWLFLTRCDAVTLLLRFSSGFLQAEIEVMLDIKNTNLTLLVPDESIAAKIKHALHSDG